MKCSKAICGLLVAAFLVSGVFVEPLPGEVAGVEQLSLTFREVVKKVRPAVVYIEVQKGIEGPAAGSGVIIDGQQGYILTANHVVKDASEVKVRLGDGREFAANDIRNDPTIDIAIIKIEADELPDADLGDSDELDVGDWVLTIGSPFGLENSVSAGIVSAKGRRTGILHGQVGIEDFIQTDAVINKGNSGGPLVNIKGEIVGINSNIISTTGMYAGLGFAVPSSLIKPTVQMLIKEGKVVRGWLGVSIISLKNLSEDRFKDVPEELKTRGGAYIEKVFSDGPAEKGGIEKGDIILAIDGEAIADSAKLVGYISAKSPGTRVKCSLWRDGKEKTIEVELGERPTELTPEQLYVIKEPREEGPAYKKLGLVVSDFRGSAVTLRGISELRAVVVDYVRPGSLAQEYAVTAGDIITEVDDEGVENAAAFEKMIEKADVRKGIKLTMLGLFGEYKVTIRPGAV